MALRMKHWVGLVTAGAALVTIWLLPLSSREDMRSRSVDSAEELRYETLSDEYRWTYESLRRTRWADSLGALTLSTAENGVAIAMPADGGIREEVVARLMTKIQGEMDAFGERSADVTFGFVYQPFEHGREDGMGTARRGRTETYVGTRDGMDYCLQLRMHSSDRLGEIVARDLVDTDLVPPRTGTLGPCRFFVKYGLAGAGVQEWLEEGGASFASESGGEKLSTRPFRRRSIFGFRTAPRSRAAVEIDECLTGDAEACAAVLLDPRDERTLLGQSQEIVRRSPVMSLGQSSLFGQNRFRDEGFLLADLEKEFGAEAFTRFWTSAAEMPVAFEAAFGVDLGTWAVTWVDAVMGVEPPGPGLPRSASSGSMLAVGLLLGIAFVRARKQKVA
jgi:hypothetical protein